MRRAAESIIEFGIPEGGESGPQEARRGSQRIKALLQKKRERR